MRRGLLAILLALLMATVSFSSITTAETTSGRGSMDVDCSGYTFEDLFDYNHALFQFIILDDWATAELSANSWVNDSKAAIVRDNIDSLFEGIEGGNNDWLSTDEREAVREIGPKCIADMYTRIGVREGVSHRGGVDWNDVEFVEEGIALDEVALIPVDHPEERACQNILASADCREVPTYATDNLEISMFVKEGEEYNSRFNQLPNSGVSNFTIALNATNMTSVIMEFNFPIVDGLRIAAYDIQDDGVSNLDVGIVEEINLPDGSLTMMITIGYDSLEWPMIRNVFVDMTTMTPETNDVPEWTSNAPVDNVIIPMFTDGDENLAVTGDALSDWATDDNGWSLDCTFEEEGWSSRMDSSGNLLVASGNSESGTAACSLVDPYGAINNSTRTWRFGQPASFSATPGTYSDSVEIEITPTLLVQNLNLSVNMVDSGSNAAPVTEVSLGSSSTSVVLSLSGLGPGPLTLQIVGQTDNMLQWDNSLIDLNIKKKNTPPTITVSELIDGSYATWSADQYSFSLSGTAMDPDGGEVSLSATMCGDTDTRFTKDGTTWDVTLSIASCVALGSTQYNVTISATDSSGASSTIDVNVPDPFTQDNNGDGDFDSIKEDSGLPAIGLFATIICMLGAALLLRRD